MANLFQKGWEALNRANLYWKQKTQPIQGATSSDKLQHLKAYFKMSEIEQNKLAEVQKGEKGEAFIIPIENHALWAWRSSMVLPVERPKCYSRFKLFPQH